MLELSDIKEPITTKEAAKVARLSVGHFRNMRSMGGGPDFARKNPSRVIYERGSVVDWAKRRQAEKIAAILGTDI